MRVPSVLAVASMLLLASRAIAADGSTSAAPATDAGFVGHGKARVTFETPAGFVGVSLLFDGVRVPATTMSMNALSVEPGDHIIDAKGMRDGRDYAFRGMVHVDPGAFVLINLPLAEVPKASACGTPAECACVTSTRTEEEVRECVAAHAPPAESCRACVISAAPPAPWSLVIFPVAALARRLTRRRARTRAGISPHA